MPPAHLLQAPLRLLGERLDNIFHGTDPIIITNLKRRAKKVTTKPATHCYKGTLLFNFCFGN